MPASHADSARIMDLICEKIALLSGERDSIDSFGGLYYRIGRYVPEHHINAALGATNDFVLRQPMGRNVPRPQVRAYFLKVIKNFCEKNKIETGIKGWWQPPGGTGGR